MPELSENIEIDSAASKPNNESTVTEQSNKPLTNGVTDEKISLNVQNKADDVDKNDVSAICEKQVYPSLPKSMLKKLGLHRDINAQGPDR